METNKSELSELTPKKVEIVINGQLFVLNQWSLEIDKWIQDEFEVTTEKLFKDAEEFSSPTLGKIIYALLDQESKRKLLAKDVEEIDMHGEVKKRRLTGPDQLLRLIPRAQIQPLFYKVVESFQQSRPEIEESKKKKK